MNKKTIITILLAIVSMAGQAQTFTWRIEGTVANAAPTDTLTVIDAKGTIVACPRNLEELETILKDLR